MRNNGTNVPRMFCYLLNRLAVIVSWREIQLHVLGFEHVTIQYADQYPDYKLALLCMYTSWALFQVRKENVCLQTLPNHPTSKNPHPRMILTTMSTTIITIKQSHQTLESRINQWPKVHSLHKVCVPVICSMALIACDLIPHGPQYNTVDGSHRTDWSLP